MTTALTGIEPLDRDVLEFSQWIKGIADRLGTPERRPAYRALRATLHALRDRIGPDPAAEFAAQLPPFIRGVFFDGYKPGAMPMVHEKSRAAFLEQVHEGGVEPLDIDQLERAAKSVLAVMGERLDHAHIDKLAALFPEEFSDLWPQAPVEWDAPVKVRRAHEPRHIVGPRLMPRPGPAVRAIKAITGIEEIDQAIHVATQWIDALEFRMNVQNSRASWAALAATLQAIREQLSAEQAVQLAAHLPLPLQGIYFEGWKPTGTTPVQTRSGFLQRIELGAWADQDIPVERAVKAAMEVIFRKVPAAAIEAIVPSLPSDLYGLWPDEPAPYGDLRGEREQPPPQPPPARSAKNIRRARTRAPGQASRNAAVAPKPGKRAH